MLNEKDLLELINIQMRARGFAMISREAAESVDFSFSMFCEENNLDSIYKSEDNSFYLSIKPSSICINCE